MSISTTNHVSPGVYIREIDMNNLQRKSSGSQTFMNRKSNEGGGGGEPGIDEYLRSIAYTDSDCSWSENEKKMLLNFYNMNGNTMTTIYLFDTNTDGDIVLDAGEFT